MQTKLTKFFLVKDLALLNHKARDYGKTCVGCDKKTFKSSSSCAFSCFSSCSSWFNVLSFKKVLAKEQKIKVKTLNHEDLRERSANKAHEDSF